MIPQYVKLMHVKRRWTDGDRLQDQEIDSLEDVLVLMGVVHSAGKMDSDSLEYSGTQWSLSTLKNFNDISPATQKHLQKVHR